MKSKLVLCAVACLVAATAPHLQALERSRAGVYALEGLGALGGCVGCGVAAGGLVALVQGGGGDINLPATGIGVVSAALLPAAVGISAAKVGARLGEDGSEGWAIGGAYAGTVVGAGLVSLGAYVGSSPSALAGVLFYVVGGLAIPIGAVVGYNVGTRHGTPARGFEGRLQPPAVALTSVELPDHSVEYGVKVQLAGLKF